MAKELSAQQKCFINYYMESSNATDAYKRAGYKCTSDNTAKSCASKLLTNANVRAYIDAMTQKTQNKAIKTIAERKEMLSRIMDNTEGESPQDAIRASAELSKMDGGYAAEKHDHTHRVEELFENVPTKYGLGRSLSNS